MVDQGTADQPFFPRDGLLLGENGPVPLVDFVVQGCSQWTEKECRGTVPLQLTFSALTFGEVLSLKWDPGDGTPSLSGSVISHTYEKVGSFTVTVVVRNASGTLSEEKSDFVVVEAALPGSECNEDEDCVGQKCVCSGTCPFPLDTGLCLQGCKQKTCHLSQTVCINLEQSGKAVADPWRTQLCLPTCATSSDCTRPGFSCRQAPGLASWHKVCVPPFPRSIGAPCRTADGMPDHSQCLGGVCLDIGASGYCSSPCEPAGCPEGSRCVQTTGLSPKTYCMLQCSSGVCADDPLLGCEIPQAQGFYGFQVIGPMDPLGTTYCTVKRCNTDESCGLNGYCDKDLGGFCLPK